MYAAKGSGSRVSAARQSADVLLQVLSERNPQLSMHLDEVTGLCEAVGQALGVPEDQMNHLLHAASLHDVGKAAIPEVILDKPAALDEDEWSYIHRHTVMGARIIAACDAYDAMTADRPYRTALSTEGALSELRACAGSQFDPAVVDGLAAVIAERRAASLAL